MARLKHQDDLRIPWERIVALQIEPIVDHPELARLNVIRKPNKKRVPFPKAWSMVLNRQTQLPILLPEVRLLRQRGTFTAREFNAPLPRPQPVRQKSAWPYVVGAILFILGLPMLAAGWVPKMPINRNEPARKSSSHLTRFVSSHFASAAELRRFIHITGATLTGASLPFLVWGGMIIASNRKRAEEEVRKHFALVDSQPSTSLLG